MAKKKEALVPAAMSSGASVSPVSSEMPVRTNAALPGEPTPAPATDENDDGKFVPLWRKITGFTPTNEIDMPYQIRWPALKALMYEFYKRIKRELDERAAMTRPPEPDAKPDPYPGNNVDNDLDPEPLDELFAITRTYQWDPLAKVCHELGISRSRLSRYCKEIKGIAAHEVMDAIKAQKVLPKLRKDMKHFVLIMYRSFRLKHKKFDCVYKEEDTRWALWKELKFRRRIPDFKTTWAIDHGFPSYARMHKACLIRYGKTPHQLEMEILLRIALKFDENCEAYMNAHPECHFVNGRASQATKVWLYEKLENEGSTKEDIRKVFNKGAQVDGNPYTVDI